MKEKQFKAGQKPEEIREETGRCYSANCAVLYGSHTEPLICDQCGTEFLLSLDVYSFKSPQGASGRHIGEHSLGSSG